MNQSLAYELNQVMPVAVETSLFSSLVTFRDRAGGDNPSTDALGQVDLANADYVDVIGLIDIPCIFSMRGTFKPDSGGGNRGPEYFEEHQNKWLLLNDYYPAVLQRFLAVVDAITYEITPGAVEHDSQEQMTRLAVRLYNL